MAAGARLLSKNKHTVAFPVAKDKAVVAKGVTEGKKEVVGDKKKVKSNSSSSVVIISLLIVTPLFKIHY